MPDKQESLAIAERLIHEAFNNGNVEAVDELLAEDFVDHADYLMDPGRARPADRHAYKRMAAMHAEAISDLNVHVEEVIVDDDHVMLRSVLTGRHTGTLYGIPASGSDLDIGVLDMFRLRDGKIVEHWWCRDDRLLYRQIGALPPVLVNRVLGRERDSEPV